MVAIPKYAIHLKFNCTSPTNKEWILATCPLLNDLTIIGTKKNLVQLRVTTLRYHYSHNNPGQTPCEKFYRDD